MSELSRRSFIRNMGLGFGFLTSEIYANSLTNLVFNDDKNNKINIDYIIYDKHIQESVSFANKMKALGIKTYGLDRDIGNMWSDIISPKWGKDSNCAIAGLSSYETLFVLKRIAMDKEMRVFYSAQHSIRKNAIIHNLNSENNIAKNFEKNINKYHWIDSLAINLKEYPHTNEKEQKIFEQNTKNTNENDKTLYSWVIAPRIS